MCLVIIIIGANLKSCGTVIEQNRTSELKYTKPLVSCNICKHFGHHAS